MEYAIPLLFLTFIPLFINMAFWMRFLRVQVQLKAHLENTQKIFAAIQRWNQIKNAQICCILLILSGAIFLQIGRSFFREIVDKVRTVIYIQQFTALFVLITTFSYQIWAVNDQLAQFFKFLTDTSYPAKRVRAVIIFVLVSGLIASTTLLYKQPNKTFRMLSTRLITFIIPVLMLLQTQTFHYLADFGFERVQEDTVDA